LGHRRPRTTPLRPRRALRRALPGLPPRLLAPDRVDRPLPRRRRPERRERVDAARRRSAAADPERARAGLRLWRRVRRPPAPRLVAVVGAMTPRAPVSGRLRVEPASRTPLPMTPRAPVSGRLRVEPASRTPLPMTPRAPVSRALGMDSGERNAAGSHLVSGHPPKTPAPRLSIP